MPEREVCSPVSRKGSKVGSGPLGLSPGARSNPSRASERLDSVPAQPTHARTSLGAEPPGGTLEVVGPKE
jgi:hypothetical protein